MTAWGKTGRVALVVYDIGEPEVDREILIDGMRVARAIRQTGSTRWFASWPGREFSPALPSRDAAVLWVLRRVDPALWRQERGEVWRVQVGTTEFPLARWHIHHPTANEGRRYGCTPGHFDSTHSWESALDAALKYSEKKAATR